MSEPRAVTAMLIMFTQDPDVVRKAFAFAQKLKIWRQFILFSRLCFAAALAGQEGRPVRFSSAFSRPRPPTRRCSDGLPNYIPTLT